MDGEYVGASRVKLGFGKPVATTCVWVDGLTEHTEKQVLSCVSRCGGATSVCVDRAAGAALVHFEQAIAAGAAVRELRRVAAHVSAAEPDRPRLAVDYASRECQVTFYSGLYIRADRLCSLENACLFRFFFYHPHVHIFSTVLNMRFVSPVYTFGLFQLSVSQTSWGEICLNLSDNSILLQFTTIC